MGEVGEPGWACALCSGILNWQALLFNCFLVSLLVACLLSYLFSGQVEVSHVHLHMVASARVTN